MLQKQRNNHKGLSDDAAKLVAKNHSDDLNGKNLLASKNLSNVMAKNAAGKADDVAVKAATKAKITAAKTAATSGAGVAKVGLKARMLAWAKPSPLTVVLITIDVLAMCLPPNSTEGLIFQTASDLLGGAAVIEGIVEGISHSRERKRAKYKNIKNGTITSLSYRDLNINKKVVEIYGRFK